MSKVKTIEWFKPEIGTADQKAVQAVLESGYINDGDVTRKFENEIAELIGARYCVGMSNGTAALALCLMALGIGKGDLVIVPDLTFIATANAVRLAGAEVKLVDIDPVRLTIDVDKAIAAVTSRTRAIIPVDVNGRGADYDCLLPLAQKHGLAVITDSCEALGSKYRGKFLGTFGNAGCFSFSPNKTITTGQGGMVATNDTKLYHRLLELKDQGRRLQGTGGDDHHPVMGFNFKLTNVQSAIGLAQLKKIRSRLEKARQRDYWYRSFLSSCPGLIFPRSHPEDGEVTQWTDILSEGREKIIQAFKKAQIDYRSFWHPIHTQLPYKEADRPYLQTISVSKKGLWLPSSFSITKREVEHVSHVILEALIT